MDDNKTVATKLSSLAWKLCEDMVDNSVLHDTFFKQLTRDGVIWYWLIQFLDVTYAIWTDFDSSVRPKDASDSNLTERLERVRPLSQISDTTRVLNGEDFQDDFKDILRSYTNVFGMKIGDLTVHDELYSCPEKNLTGYRRRFPRGKFGVFATYIPKLPRLLLALSVRTFPTRWRVKFLPSEFLQVNHTRRRQISFRPDLAQSGSFEHFLRTILSFYLPRSMVEDALLIQHELKRVNRKRYKVIFTSNLHLSSDPFLFWIVEQRNRGTRVVLSQHGGLYGQGAIPTRGAEFEQWFADTYFHWGWCLSPNAVKVPAQITMWKRKRRKSNNHKQLVLVTDCTFRYSRRPWPCDEENRRYRSMLLSSYGSIPMRLVGNVIVRLHHDHDKYDDSHSDMWRDAYPTVQLDDGLGPIDKLRKRARLMVSMSLGTSEIEQFARNIPTILRIDPVVHALRESCVELFSDMEKVGLVHWSDESFSAFLDENWYDIDAWWTSTSVREVVARYLDQFGYQSKKPLREFRAALKAAVAV